MLVQRISLEVDLCIVIKLSLYCFIVVEEKKAGASLVALGILLSRISGLVRERVFAHYFGNTDAADAFRAALKIPNLLQNLLGEGVLSAAFIPIYAKLKSQNDDVEASLLAKTIFSLLAVVTSFVVLLGVWATPWLIDWITPGFEGAKRDLSIQLVRIFFPGTACLVFSAWCLGILNSHRKFFLSYAAPVVWNAAIIVSMLIWGPRSGLEDLAVIVAWGLVVGSLLQFLIQLPSVLVLTKGIQLHFSTKSKNVVLVLKNFFPAVLARGVVQVSAYVDNMIASLLATGAVSTLGYAQVLYMLPISLFGMSVSAAELPLMSEASGTPDEISSFLKDRLAKSKRRIAFFVIPTAVAFIGIGFAVISLLYKTGKFQEAETIQVWKVLAVMSLALWATTLGRLYSSAFYSLRDTKTPLKFAALRVIIGSLFGYWLSTHYGIVGLVFASSMSSMLEAFFLSQTLEKRIGKITLSERLYPIMLTSFLAVASVIFIRHFFFIQGSEAMQGYAAQFSWTTSLLFLILYGLFFAGFGLLFKLPELIKITTFLKLRK